jgi:hypothetical protein
MDEIELHLELQRDETKTPRRQMTEGMLNPAISNAEACMRFMQPGWTGAGLTEAMEVLSERTKAVNAGDMRDMEGTLVAQTAALNSIFIELTRRAHLNIGQNLDVTDRYLRLAFKAQSQCRATVESLALIKNPRVYAKQANINNGGQQQVNNGVPADVERSARARACPSKSKTPQTELLEASNGQRMDTRAKSKARRGNQALEAVGEVHRTQDA